MLFEFCGMETRGACLRGVCFDMQWRGVDSRWCAQDLEVDEARGRLIIYRVMLKMELESDGGFHSTDGGAMA
jgi:hypothetical protein